MRYAVSIMLALAMLFSLFGCGEVQEASGTKIDIPQAHSVVYGKIRSASGNEIIVALLNYPEGADAQGGGWAGINTAAEGTPSAEGGEAQSRPARGESTGQGGERAAEGSSATQGGSSERGGGTDRGGELTAGESPPDGSGAESTTAQGSAQGQSGERTGEAMQRIAERVAESGRSGELLERAGEWAERVQSSGGAAGRGTGERLQGGLGSFMTGAGAAMAAANYTLTGEDATYLIPVTAVITTGEGEGARSIRFTQLSYKNVVKISLDEQGNIIALQVIG